MNRTSILKNSYGKHSIKNNLKCSCKNSIFEKVNDNAIICEDGNIMHKYKCNKCGSSICNYSKCRSKRNFCKDRKSANKHRRKKHSNDNVIENTIEGNEVEETSEIETALTGGFNEMDIEIELNYMNYTNDLQIEDDKYREFIKHLNKDTVSHYLVAISQDKRFTNERCENLSSVDLDLQIKLTRLHSELSTK